MRHASLCLTLLLLLGGVVGCQSGNPATVAPDPASTADAQFPSEIPASALQTMVADNGMAESVLGLFLLEPPTKPGALPKLTPIRMGTGQGDLFTLSIMPFLKPTSLTLISATPIDDTWTDYRVSFTHPFPMPTDLERPATAAKRADLFLFDLQVVVVSEGSDSFFEGDVVANVGLIQNAHGYRQLGPLVDLSVLGVTQANTFPYRVMSGYDAADPTGNYSPTKGWTADNLRTASGYDVVRQGQNVQRGLVGPTQLPGAIGVVLVAKYLDPRGGSTPDEQRANRLPDPDDSGALMYYLPEAAGDNAIMSVFVTGEITEGSDVEQVQIRGKMLDWDNSATVAASFPDPASPSMIRSSSLPHNVAASVPLLSDTPFTLSQPGEVTGVAQEWINRTVYVNNVLKTVTPPPGEVMEISGMLRVGDSQDVVQTITLLDEEQQPVAPPLGFAPSNRYQTFTLNVNSTRYPPVITEVIPFGGSPGQAVTFQLTATGPAATSWAWNFGSGASPNASSEQSPQVTLSAAGVYNGTVTATNAYGASVPFPFTITVGTIPTVIGVTPAGHVGFAGELATFAAQAGGGLATGWSWTFGGGASPNTSSLQSPQVTLGAAGSYQGTVTLSNAFGSTPAFQFLYEIDPAVAPSIQLVNPTGAIGITGSQLTFDAETTGLIETWIWNFGGGVLPNTSSSDTPSVLLGGAGDYQGQLIVSNRFGASLPFDFDYTILPTPAPVISSVSPTGAAGITGTSATFSAIASNNPTSWTWDFGGGATPNTSTAASPQVTLGATGTYTGEVTATNGTGTSPIFEFEYTVSSLPPISWASDTWANQDCYDGNVFLWEGYPTIMYGSSTGGTTFARSQELVPTATSGWDTHSFGPNRPGNKIINHNGRIAFCSSRSAIPKVLVSYATVAIPASSGDWVTLELSFDGDGSDTGAHWPALASAGGLLHLTHRSIDGDGYDYWRSNTTFPVADDPWTGIVFSLGGVSRSPDIGMIDGAPAIIHCGNTSLNIMQALTPTPTVAGDWYTYSITNFVKDNTHIGTSPQGVPVIMGGTTTVKLMVAKKADPISPTDWNPACTVTTNGYGSYGVQSNLAFASDGRPAITYMVRNGINFEYQASVALASQLVPADNNWSKKTFNDIDDTAPMATVGLCADNTPLVLFGRSYMSYQSPRVADMYLQIASRPW